MSRMSATGELSQVTLGWYGGDPTARRPQTRVQKPAGPAAVPVADPECDFLAEGQQEQPESVPLAPAASSKGPAAPLQYLSIDNEVGEDATLAFLLQNLLGVSDQSAAASIQALDHGPEKWEQSEDEEEPVLDDDDHMEAQEASDAESEGIHEPEKALAALDAFEALLVDKGLYMDGDIVRHSGNHDKLGRIVDYFGGNRFVDYDVQVLCTKHGHSKCKMFLSCRKVSQIKAKEIGLRWLLNRECTLDKHLREAFEIKKSIGMKPREQK